MPWELLFAPAQFSDKPENRKDDGDDPEQVEEYPGDGEGNPEDDPEDQQKNGKGEEFAHF